MLLTTPMPSSCFPLPRWCAAGLSLLAMLLSAGSAVAQVHPRLLFGPEDIPALREKITREPFKTMYEVLLADVETGQYRSYAGPTPEFPDRPADPYGEGINGWRCGFLYVLTGDDAWAARARFYVERRINDTTNYRWANSSQKGLNLYFTGKNVALTYDLCYGAPSWDAEFTALVNAKMLAQADVIATSGGSEQNTNSASNWQGLRGSSAALLYLALDLPYDSARYTSMYNKVQSYLRDNYANSATSRGWNIEGIGYLGYPMATVAPLMVAAKRANPAQDLALATPATEWMLWSQYAATVRFRRDDRILLLHPDFGDDNATADDANGMYGFAFHFCPPTLHPGLRHWYERLLVPEGNWDYTRGGTIFSILYFPDTVEPADPITSPTWLQGFDDSGGNGYFTYRNQYETADDMVAQMYVKLRGNRGHSGPDALSFRILGLNSTFAVGGGRYGVKTNNQDVFWRSQNTLYPVDPDATLSTNGNSGSVVGSPVVFSDGGGHMVSSIAKNNVGTTSQKRWFVADHDRATTGVEAVYVIGDTSLDGFFWQLNTLAENTIEVVDGHTFLIHGQDGATMRGQVVYPTEPVLFTTGTRVRGSKFAYGNFGDDNDFIHFRGAGDFVVVLTAAKSGQTHPDARLVRGRVINAEIEVGPKRYVLTSDSVLYETDGPALPTPPAAPAGFVARGHASFREAVLTWQPVPEAEGYLIHRSDDAGATWQVVGKLPSGSLGNFQDLNLAAGATFQYRVQAINGGGDSPMSAPSTAQISDGTANQIVAEESFEGLPPGPLSGLGSGFGWAGPWSPGGATVVDVSTNPLVANGLQGGDRAVRYAWGNECGRRSFAAAPNMTTGVWMSYLMRYDSGTYGADESAWIFSTSQNWDWGFVGIKANSSHAWRASAFYNQGTNGGGAIVPGQTYHVVAHLTRNRLRLWINPSAETDTPAIDHVNADTRAWSNFPGIGLSSRSDSDVFLIDRITVGQTFAAALAGAPAEPGLTAWLDTALAALPPEDREPHADPDGDGLPNALAYALGVTGTGPAPAHRPIFETTGAGELGLRFWRRKSLPGLTLAVEASTGLGDPTWTVPTASWHVLADEADRQQVEVRVLPPESATAWFLRLRLDGL